MLDAAREKMELYDEYVYIVAKEVDFLPNTNVLSTTTMNIIIFEDLLVSIHIQPFYGMADVLYSLKFKQPGDEFEKPHPSWVAYHLLDYVVDLYFKHVQRIENETRALEALVGLVKFTMESHAAALGRLSMS